MTRWTVVRTLTFVLFLVPTNFVLATPPPITPPYKITKIKAQLFHEGTATFSTDVLAKPDFAFWNTIIGEGDAGAPSNSTLILVEVSGKTPSGEVPPQRSVELTASTPKKVLVKRTVEIWIGDGGKFYAAFWLYSTGCEPVTLVARIIGQTQPSTMTRKIPFQCGE